MFRIVGVLVLSLMLKECTSQSRRPCPEVFEYSVEDGKIYGEITIAAPKAGQWTHLQVDIGSDGEIRNNNAFIRLDKSRDETAQDALDGEDIKYRMLFPDTTNYPTIKKITLNNKVVCNENSGFFHTTWSFKHSFYFGNVSVRTEHSSITEENYPAFFDWLYARSNSKSTENPTENPIEKPSTQPTPTPPTPTPPTPTPPTPTPTITRRMPPSGIWTTSLPLDCGKGKRMVQKRALVARPLILNGNPVLKEEYPWLVYFEYEVRNKICGGTLISDKHIITAAHCITPDTVIGVQLGKYDRYTTEKGSKRVKPVDIIFHPDYRASEPHADIGIVFIEPLVKFTPQIRPACLWPFGTDYDRDPQFRFGTVAGWGVFTDTHNNASRFPMKTVVPIVDLETCRKSNQLFVDLATDHTICAGGLFSGPCPGDSGSGLYMQYNNMWFLRGMVSITATPQFTDYCTSDFYAVYVDVAFYLDWLKPYLDDVASISPRFRNKAVIEIDNFI